MIFYNSLELKFKDNPKMSRYEIFKEVLNYRYFIGPFVEMERYTLFLSKTNKKHWPKFNDDLTLPTESLFWRINGAYIVCNVDQLRLWYFRIQS